MDQSLDFNKTRLYNLVSNLEELKFMRDVYNGDLNNKELNLLDVTSSFDNNNLKLAEYDRSLFAYRQEYKFPCHTKPATILSSAYFFFYYPKLENYDEIRNNIYKFANYFNCVKEVSSIEEKANNYKNKQKNKVKINNSKFSEFVIEDRKDFDFVVDYLISNKSNIQIQDRFNAANKLLDIAFKRDYDLYDYQENELMKLAGMGECSVSDFKNFITELKGICRFNKFLNNEQKDTILKEIDEIIDDEFTEKHGEFDDYEHNLEDEERMCKVGRKARYNLAVCYENLCKIGKIAGSKSFQCPEDVLFRITEPMIQEEENKLIYNKKLDKYYHKNALSFINYSMIKNCLGEKFAEKLKGKKSMSFLSKLKYVLENESDDEELLKFDELVNYVTM